MVKKKVFLESSDFVKMWRASLVRECIRMHAGNTVPGMVINVFLLPLYSFYGLISSLVQVKKTRYATSGRNRNGKRIWGLIVELGFSQ